MPIKQVKVKIGIPYIGDVEGTWEPDDNERRAAWEMHVELATRISVAELQPGEGVGRQNLGRSGGALVNVVQPVQHRT